MTRSGWFATGAALALGAGMLAGCAADPEPPVTLDPPSPTPVAEAFPACLVGTWTASGEQLQPVYDAIPLELDYPQASIDPDATATISFDEAGGFTFTQDVPVDLSWEGNPASVRLTGSMTGIATAADGSELALTPVENDLEVIPADDRTGSALFAGATQETLAEWPVAASGYTCDADESTIALWTEGHRTTVAFAWAE
ncbi:hypothetical protein GCM10022200_25110 [Microbacterium awajiense]|uniref:Lipoprotein n=1 Tax=Microbacterium awajiense TaxID=415214 RepID=A0ABP7ATS9_9MICO